MELSGSNLIIRDVQLSDAGQYDCEIELDRKGWERKIYQTRKKENKMNKLQIVFGPMHR